MAESEIHKILSQALDADESGNVELAIQLYTQSVEAILRIEDKDERGRFTKFATQSLDRAEKLKGIQRSPDASPTTSNFRTVVPVKSLNVPPTTAAAATTLGISGSRAYTDDEKRVLEHTSHINSNIFVPFMNVDLHEKFVYSIPFTDKVHIIVLIIILR